MKYEKPMVIVNNMLAEGVYTASGDLSGKCNSVYMNGVWQQPDYSDWGGVDRGYKQQYGCLGCPSYTATGCGLDSHFVDSGMSGSYDQDNGNRKPTWEKRGYKPDDVVSDWNCG